MKTKIGLLFCLSANMLLANNVTVENVSLTNQNSTTDVKDIQFDISWDNSWRTSAAPNNWDACWVFAKYRLTSGTVWSHATLSTTNADHNAPSGSTIDAVSDGKGVFIHRSADGSGNNNFDAVRINWDYGIDGLLDNDSVQICVFAIEMVNIPNGDFTLGDGNGTNESLYAFESATNNNTAVSITPALSELIETDGSGSDDVQLRSTGLYLDGDGGIDLNGNGSFADAGDNANFPVGYNEIYCMKYEITQGQYAEFANKLNTGQAAAIIANHTDNRINISGSGTSWSSTTPNRAMDMGWYEFCAYLDWAALRPMTETEFEKIARGTNAAVYGEYPWGTTNLHAAAYTLNFDGTGSEAITNMGTTTGNANYNTTEGAKNGPLRSGIFAAGSANNTREETGGSYYGVMELSGNICEQVVFMGAAAGRAFDGSHGDGEVHSTGFANVSGWPAFDGADNNLNDGGFIPRGGDWNGPVTEMRTSDRTLIGTHPTTTGSDVYGGRGIRTP
jgi:formylglycine-generating enzyme required for sulfatase activity